ncbi:Inactive ubiquitin carboxyl-terminal hydrolase [Globisporangium polare]
MSGDGTNGATSSAELLPWADGRTRPLSQRKGLSNELGENNCFLNVIIQSLWHVRSCRVLISMGDHAVHHRCGGDIAKAGATTNGGARATGSPCLLCELEQIFILYQFSEDPVLDVDRVRVALSDVFALGDMNDATETLEAILDALHWDTLNRMLTIRRGSHVPLHTGELSHSMKEDASAIVCEPMCIAHLVFQMNMMELKTCSQCGATSDPLMNTDFLYRVYAQELLTHAKDKTLEEVLRLEAQGGATGPSDFVSKCEDCKAKMQTSRWILTLPMVFAVSVIWSSDHVNKGEVKAWMDLLSSQSGPPAKRGGVGGQQTLHLGKIFHLDNKSVASDYSFRGMVCYYGRHYVGFFASRSIIEGVEQERWYLFDDTRVKLVGTWADVRSRVERGGYQPTLLFYERNGLEQAKLESTATEIHKWWKETADEEEGKQAADTKTEQLVPVTENGSLVSEDKMDLITAMKESLRVRPPSSLQLPVSPIKSGLPPPLSVPLNGTSANGWHEEDLYLMHKSAEDTLSRLNGILSKDRIPGSVDGPGDLRRTMSMSMRRSVRKRDYSFRSTGQQELEVNRDEIFNDSQDPETSRPVPIAHQVIPETTYGFDQTKTSGKNHSHQNHVHFQETKEFIAEVQKKEVVHAPFKVFDVKLNATDGGIGLLLEEAQASRSALANCKNAFVVQGFEANGAGKKLAAEASGDIKKDDVLVAINGKILETEALRDVLELLWTSPNPVELVFHRFQPWACEKCTLLNDANVITCGACGYTVELRNTETPAAR